LAPERSCQFRARPKRQRSTTLLVRQLARELDQLQRHFGGKSEPGARGQPDPPVRAVVSSETAPPTYARCAVRVPPAGLPPTPTPWPQATGLFAPARRPGKAPRATDSSAQAPRVLPRSAQCVGPSATCRPCTRARLRGPPSATDH